VKEREIVFLTLSFTLSLSQGFAFRACGRVQLNTTTWHGILGQYRLR
jgi:hypothetical protein